FTGPHIVLMQGARIATVTNMGQANALLERYSKVGDHLDGALRLHRRLAGTGQTPAQAALDRVLSQLDGYLGSGLDTDPFLRLKLPQSGETADRWREKATELVQTVIRPAVQTYRDGLVEHIAPVARPDDKCGLIWMEGGEELYAHLIHKYTQLDKTPQEIHDIGLQWATEINAAEWVEIGGEAFGATTMDEVFGALRSAPEAHFSSEEEMLSHARAAVERAWGAVPDWFGALPKTMCDVVPVPAEVAPAMPPAYYSQPPIDGSRDGQYFLNTYKPEQRERFEYESIHFHEAVPGHHFDRSLAAESPGIPAFRRYSLVYAYTEGWGLYSERLADEMGLYSSPSDRLGMISADAWRAGRLVVDTGMHALGWDKQQAIDFLQKWTPIGALTIEQEVDRYIGMAGQALAYKMGQLEIFRLRRHAEKTLGDGFDIKGFHDTLLTHGAMPLPLLGQVVQEWIESRS
ncbi:MAG: DUF885 domain-containing protein, partial [Acidimicrobiia bacterium]|nr:DUF885 domain-containing protein [Acidimicrobiia bacterium]